MYSSFASYLIRPYVVWYVALIAIPATVAAKFLTEPRYSFFILVPMSFVATLALCATLFQLSSDRGLETLQSFGVDERSFSSPLFLAGFAPQLAATAITLPFAKSHEASVTVGVAGLLGTIVALVLILRIAWRSREERVIGACLTGITAQIVVVGSVLVAAQYSDALVATLIGLATTAIGGVIALRFGGSSP